MSKPPTKRVTALREVSTPQALRGHPCCRVLSGRSWPRAHAEFFVHRRPCTSVACKKHAAKCFPVCTTRLQQHIGSKKCLPFAGHRVISMCTHARELKKVHKNGCPPCIQPTPLSRAPESRAPTTPESDLTIAFRIFLRSSFVHLLVQHDRSTAAAILESAGPG